MLARDLSEEDRKEGRKAGRKEDRKTGVKEDRPSPPLLTINSEPHSGNHDATGQPNFQYILDRVAGGGPSHYAFEQSNMTFVVLDGNYNVLGEHSGMPSSRMFIPDEQLVWLDAQLSAAPGYVAVFNHYPFCGEGSTPESCVDNGIDDVHVQRNAPDARAIFEAHADKIAGVFSGHNHQTGFLDVYNAVPYFTMFGMVEFSDVNSYSVVEFGTSDGSVCVHGRGLQPDFCVSK
jgi:hypothetical protein